MELKKFCATTDIIILSILLLVSVCMILGAGSVMKGYGSTAIRAANFVPSTCYLTQSTIVTIDGPPTSFYCLTTKYIAVWMTSDGYSAIDFPLAASSSLSYIQSELNNYPMNKSVECVCDANFVTVYPAIEKYVPCNFYARCFLNTAVVEFIQSNAYLNNIGISYIIVGSIFFFLLALFTIIQCFLFCRNRESYVDLP